MRALSWLVRLVLFLVMMGFALSNTDTATLRFFGIPEFEWRAPLVLLLLAFFAAGTVLGALAAMPLVLRQRRELSRLRRELASRPPVDAVAAVAVAPDPCPPVRRESGVRGI
ncbi:MAG TPA: lipopolysaccharide assembly protein LapA domain-containing protein [Burkholderiaceae bacterium]|nr:lipopolysaccharide assembly protein LapA domain-containing protein [Burkholderiaceae bacterium]